MLLQLFDTYSLSKKSIAPINDKFITLYTCGPTVYDYAHIGNFRTYVFEDLLKRTLLFLGYRVKHVMNLTDVDDKTIKGAKEKNISLEEYTKPYIDAFFDDINTLNIMPADDYPKATDYINEMIVIIQKLMEKNIAYEGKDGSIYFSIEDFPPYGKLSHLNLEELKTGASERIDLDEYEKENISDFVLWKSYEEKRDGKIFWDSPFGRGRPGWHIECSAMALKLLGNTIDIHCGGVDNIFPHHENEIAQSESYTNEKFVNNWVHSTHLVVNNKKMSKSLGNFYTLRDLLSKGYTGTQIRFLLLQTHYRNQLNFTLESLSAAKNALNRVSDFLIRLNYIDIKNSAVKIDEIINTYKEKFMTAIADDLNISSALAAFFDFIREINSYIDDDKISKKDQKKIISFLENLNQVLGFISFDIFTDIPQEIIDYANERQIAKNEKNYEKADALREKIFADGFVIEDAAKGFIIKKK